MDHSSNGEIRKLANLQSVNRKIERIKKYIFFETNGTNAFKITETEYGNMKKVS